MTSFFLHLSVPHSVPCALTVLKLTLSSNTLPQFLLIRPDMIAIPKRTCATMLVMISAALLHIALVAALQGATVGATPAASGQSSNFVHPLEMLILYPPFGPPYPPPMSTEASVREFTVSTPPSNDNENDDDKDDDDAANKLFRQASEFDKNRLRESINSENQDNRDLGSNQTVAATPRHNIWHNTDQEVEEEEQITRTVFSDAEITYIAGVICAYTFPDFKKQAKQLEQTMKDHRELFQQHLTPISIFPMPPHSGEVGGSSVEDEVYLTDGGGGKTTESPMTVEDEWSKKSSTKNAFQATLKKAKKKMPMSGQQQLLLLTCCLSSLHFLFQLTATVLFTCPKWLKMCFGCPSPVSSSVSAPISTSLSSSSSSAHEIDDNGGGNGGDRNARPPSSHRAEYANYFEVTPTDTDTDYRSQVTTSYRGTGGIPVEQLEMRNLSGVSGDAAAANRGVLRVSINPSTVYYHSDAPVVESLV